MQHGKRRLSLKEWIGLLKNSGYEGKQIILQLSLLSRKHRQYNYRTGSFTMPLSTIRAELNLRSTFFSVYAEGDSVILKGRGYGHGVGLMPGRSNGDGRRGLQLQSDN